METRPEPAFRDQRRGLGDVEAAVALVSRGVASRIVLSEFAEWAELLAVAQRLAADAGVVAMAAVLSPGGAVDIVVTRATDD